MVDVIKEVQSDKICVCVRENFEVLSRLEALQLAKDLLNVCQEPDASLGMDLDEIQKGAENIRLSGCVLNTSVEGELALLIANLAAEIKKRGPDLGDRIVCSCGQVHRYQKIVK